MTVQVIFGHAGLDEDLAAILSLDGGIVPAQAARPHEGAPSPPDEQPAPSFRQQEERLSPHGPRSQGVPVPPSQASFNSPENDALSREEPPAPAGPVESERPQQQKVGGGTPLNTASPSPEPAFVVSIQKASALLPWRRLAGPILAGEPTLRASASLALALVLGVGLFMHQAVFDKHEEIPSRPTSPTPRLQHSESSAETTAISARSPPAHGLPIKTHSFEPAGAPKVVTAHVAVANIAAAKSHPASKKAALVETMRGEPADFAQTSLRSSSSLYPPSTGDYGAVPHAADPAAQPSPLVTVARAGTTLLVTADLPFNTTNAVDGQHARSERPPTRDEPVPPAPRLRRDSIDAIRALRRQ